MLIYSHNRQPGNFFIFSHGLKIVEERRGWNPWWRLVRMFQVHKAQVFLLSPANIIGLVGIKWKGSNTEYDSGESKQNSLTTLGPSRRTWSFSFQVKLWNTRMLNSDGINRLSYSNFKVVFNLVWYDKKKTKTKIKT
jgi:hypothetical protein